MGLQSRIKVKKVFNHIRSLDADIIFLQETHPSRLEHTKLRKPWISQVIHSNYNSRSRGVAILIKEYILHRPISYLTSMVDILLLWAHFSKLRWY